jgi:hypothetical protein
MNNALLRALPRAASTRLPDAAGRRCWQTLLADAAFSSFAGLLS